jgi:hypothetical protein
VTSAAINLWPEELGNKNWENGISMTKCYTGRAGERKRMIVHACFLPG